jgi:hypothetical protein
MAGRYIILTFDDKDEAETFALEMMEVPQGEMPHLPGSARIFGMFIKPMKFCECPDKRRQDGRNWFKGKNTGLFLHQDCRRPSVFHQRGLMDRLCHILGKNLVGGSE